MHLFTITCTYQFSEGRILHPLVTSGKKQNKSKPSDSEMLYEHNGNKPSVKCMTKSKANHHTPHERRKPKSLLTNVGDSIEVHRWA